MTKNYFIRTSDPKVKKLLKDMAKEDKRSISYKIAWLNNEEWNRRHKEQEKQVEISFL